jgi:hypothetical protein
MINKHITKKNLKKPLFYIWIKIVYLFLVINLNHNCCQKNNLLFNLVNDSQNTPDYE